MKRYTCTFEPNPYGGDCKHLDTDDERKAKLWIRRNLAKNLDLAHASIHDNQLDKYIFLEEN